MANRHREIDVDKLNQLAWEYIKVCESHTIEVPTPRGTICKVVRRKIPTLEYFLYIWMQDRYPAFWKRSNWYKILRDPEHPYHVPVQAINEAFSALAVDVVANEGKGIFYAKNRLGMAEKTERHDTQIQKLIVEHRSSGLPPTKSEKDVSY